MKTTAIRLYGKKDLRMEEFELPQLKDNEILAKVVSDSLCMSSYKASSQGAEHKRIPDNVAENPIIIGHEFADGSALGAETERMLSLSPLTEPTELQKSAKASLPEGPIEDAEAVAAWYDAVAKGFRRVAE